MTTSIIYSANVLPLVLPEYLKLLAFLGLCALVYFYNKKTGTASKITSTGMKLVFFLSF